MQWNAQGITTTTAINELQHFIDCHQIDAVCLCETTYHKLYLNNFRIYRNDRINPGGGVAIGINKNIKHELLPVCDTISIENISIAVQLNNKKLILTCAYNPRYTASFTSDIEKLTPTDNEFILLGDLNAKNTAWNCTSNNMAGNTLLNIQQRRNFFIQHSCSPTHYPHSGSTPSTIDIMLSNTTLHTSNPISHTHELASDHAPISCIVAAVIETENPSQMFHFKNADWIAYKICVNDNIELDDLFTNKDDIDKGLDHIINAMHEAKRRSVPLVSKHNDYIRLSRDTEIDLGGTKCSETAVATLRSGRPQKTNQEPNKQCKPPNRYDRQY